MFSIMDTCLAGTLSLVPAFSVLRFCSKKDEKILPAKKRLELEILVNTLAEKIGIKKHIEIKEVSNFSAGAQAFGSNLLPVSPAIILDPELFVSISPSEQEFLIGHELSHIKYDDLLKMSVVSGLLGVISTVALKVLFPSLAIFSISLGSSPAAFIGFVVSSVALIMYSRKSEEQADKTSFSLCSHRNKNGGAKLFKRVQKNAISVRNEEGCSFWSNLWHKIAITNEGNTRYDIMHPSLTSRIKYLERQKTVYAGF